MTIHPRRGKMKKPSTADNEDALPPNEDRLRHDDRVAIACAWCCASWERPVIVPLSAICRVCRRSPAIVDQAYVSSVVDDGSHTWKHGELCHACHMDAHPKKPPLSSSSPFKMWRNL